MSSPYGEFFGSCIKYAIDYISYSFIYDGMMIRKTKDSDTTPDMVQAVIEHIQPKQCCIHPHEGCTPTKDFVEYEQKSQAREKFWKKKIQRLQAQQSI